MSDRRPVDDDPHVLGPDLAPTPFTADEIRQGCPVGRTIRVLVEPDGEASSYRINRYVAVDEQGATIERTLLAADGSPIGRPETVVTTWLDLQRHASFPADRTEIGRERIDTPVGQRECLRYTVRDGQVVETFWFADAAPGMPVRYTTEVGGRTTMTTTLVADDRPDRP